MVERCALSSPYTSVAVCSLLVACIVETLGNGTPLHGEVLVVVERCCLVDAPAQRAVVYDDVASVLPPEGVGTVVHVDSVASSYPYEPYYHVVCLILQRIVTDGDAVTWGSLSLYGHVAILYDKVAFQSYCTRHVKYNDTLSRSVLQCFTQRPCA